MQRLMLPAGLMIAFGRIGAMSLICGFKYAAALNFGFYVIQFAIGGDD